MRLILAIAAVLLMTSQIVESQTLLGNCGAAITGIQLSTGNIYCISAPSGCAGSGFDFTNACNSQYVSVF